MRDRASSTKSEMVLAPDSTTFLPLSTTLFKVFDMSSRFRLLLPRRRDRRGSSRVDGVPRHKTFKPNPAAVCC